MKENSEKVVYEHLVFNGTAYEVGKLEGDYLKRYHPEQVSMFTEGTECIKPVSIEKAKRAIEVFARYCPHINDEISGLAESLGVSSESIIHYAFSYVSKGNCGHFAVLPSRTADKHMYVGRSYEWSTEDELRLMTVKVKGFNAHIGFSILLMGRMDGINEHGLCITMSNAIPCEQSEEEGLRFWMVIRILLDNCKTTEEAVELIKELPISSYCSLIITDKHHKVVLAEIFNSNKSFKIINNKTEADYVCSTNHYTLSEMKCFVKNKMKQSVDRYNAMTKKLDTQRKLHKNELKGILSRHMPEGLACHYYDYGLGTLWSMLFDVSETKVDICFGSPVVNEWHTFDLNSKPGVTRYDAMLPKEKAEDRMWEKV